MEGVWGGVSVRGDRAVITSRVLKSATHSSEAEATVSLGRCVVLGALQTLVCHNMH